MTEPVQMLPKEDDASAEARIVRRSMQNLELDMLDRDKAVHTGAGRFLERVEALMRPRPVAAPEVEEAW